MLSLLWARSANAHISVFAFASLQNPAISKSKNGVLPGNIGIVLGEINEYGIGYELFYSFTVADDEDTDQGVKITAETDVIGLFAVYQTPGDIYLKGKLGYGFVSLKFDSIDLGSSSDSTSGLSYGLAGGYDFGGTTLELTYYRFADLEEFDGIDIDNEKVEMLNLTVLWSF